MVYSYGWGIGIRTPTNRVRVCRAAVTQFPNIKFLDKQSLPLGENFAVTVRSLLPPWSISSPGNIPPSAVCRVCRAAVTQFPNIGVPISFALIYSITTNLFCQYFFQKIRKTFFIFIFSVMCHDKKPPFYLQTASDVL